MNFVLRKDFIYSLFAAILTGVLIAVGFPGVIFREFGFGWLEPIAFVPLFIAMDLLPIGTYSSSRSTKAKTITNLTRGIGAAILCWISGTVMWGLSFFWVTYPTILFGKISEPLTYTSYIFVAMISGLYLPILLSPFIFNVARNSKKHVKKFPIICMAIICACIERWYPGFFFWTLGSLMHFSDAINQWGAVLGFSSITIFILFSSGVISRSITSYPRSFPRIIYNCLFIVALWFCIYFIGNFRLHKLDNVINSPNAENIKFTKVGFVQPNFTFSELSSNPNRLPKAKDQSLSFVLNMSQKLLDDNVNNKPDLIVWPESVVPNDYLWNKSNMEKTWDFAEKNKIPVLVQAIEMNEEEVKTHGWKDATIYGVSFLMRPDRSKSQLFRKWNPIPFGETIPYEDFFPGFAKFLRANIGNLSKVGMGTTPDTLPYSSDYSFVAPLICFDTSLSELPRLQALKGEAMIFVNQANFVWMGESSAGFQFKELARFRAIENGRSLLMAANTGPTIAFDPLGRPIQFELNGNKVKFADILKPASGVITLPVVSFSTFYTQFGNYPLILLGIISLLTLLFMVYKSNN